MENNFLYLQQQVHVEQVDYIKLVLIHRHIPYQLQAI